MAKCQKRTHQFTHYYNYVELSLAICAESVLAESHFDGTAPFSIFNFNLQSLHHPFSDGFEAEILRADVFGSNPETFCGIISRTEGGDIGHLASEKHVERRDDHA